jgi:hypothetical protein
VLRAADLRAAPWRGGTVREIATGGGDPEGGAGWRLGLADVEGPGELSLVPGTERVLTVVDGELLVLDVDGREQGLERHRPFRLPGDVPVAAALPTGPVRVLDVVARREAVRAHVVVLELSKKRPHPVFAGQFAVLLAGRAVVTAGGAETGLAVYDTVRGAEPESPEITGRGFLAVVSLDPVTPS